MLHYLLLLGSLLPGGGFTYIAGAYFWRGHWLRTHGQRAQGRVLRSEVETTGRGGAYFTSVGFVAASGEAIEVELALGLPWRAFEVGEAVAVYYDPSHPRQCVVASRVEGWSYLGLALVGWLVTGLMLWDVLTHR